VKSSEWGHFKLVVADVFVGFLTRLAFLKESIRACTASIWRSGDWVVQFNVGC